MHMAGQDPVAPRHNLVTPALSVSQLMGSFSSSKVLKKTRW